MKVYVPYVIVLQLFRSILWASLVPVEHYSRLKESKSDASHEQKIDGLDVAKEEDTQSWYVTMSVLGPFSTQRRLRHAPIRGGRQESQERVCVPLSGNTIWSGSTSTASTLTMW